MRFIESLCRLICVASVILFAGCRNEMPTQNATASQISAVPAVSDGWELYEDAEIRFQHPKERKIVPIPGEAKGYFVMEPGDIDGLPGPESISILPKSSPNPVGMSLREIVLDRLKDAAKEGVKLVGPLQNIVLPGGRCVHCVTEGYNSGGCMTSAGNKAVCRCLLLSSECEAWEDVPMRIVSITEAYPDAGKPSPRAREQVQVFERLVKSIEFKK